MRVLLDTGILLRLRIAGDPLHEEVVDAMATLRRQNAQLVTLVQNIAEYWNVATRPTTARGGFGLSIPTVTRDLAMLESDIQVLREPPSAYRHFKRLLVQHSVQGNRCMRPGWWRR